MVLLVLSLCACGKQTVKGLQVGFARENITPTSNVWLMGGGDPNRISESGRFIRENSPYKNTFIITNTNDSRGYIPSEFGYEINCYEAYSSKAKAGSGEIMAQAFVDLLTDLKGN